MTNALPQREVARINIPQVERGYTDSHKVRRLMPPGDWAATDPFLLLMEDWAGPGVFEPHPHRGMETFTFLLEGEIEHYDNHGNKGSISAGDALMMTAGRGIVHDERSADGGVLHLLQLWINLPRRDKLAPSRVQEIPVADVPKHIEPGVEVRVLSGRSGDAVSPTQNFAPFMGLELRLDSDAAFEQQLPADYNGFILVIDGEASIGVADRKVDAGGLAWLTFSDTPSAVTVKAGQAGLRALLFAGLPLREPVAARGPFVMNTDAELDVSYAEYRAQGDRFGADLTSRSLTATD
ncbi:pirin family protein [Brevundimonas sp.]|uniref:pirin family protein n=1 Tax=Brevundimonas sp. TaxID=1871086 RepID=UPI001A2DBF94|nr:pirin family protein [Brevundimonas sp.]MBJ7485134.1 pirin family protein [Brevundimonas sp.]